MKKKRSIHGLSPCVLKFLKIMKLTVFLMLISIASVFALETYAQSTKLSLKVEGISLEQFLIKIENQSEYRFFYTGNIDIDKKVTGEFKNKKITEILDDIREETGIHYEVLGRQIILSPDDKTTKVKSLQQQKPVSGKVTDDKGDPLPGVTVVVEGTTYGTVTDFNGTYTLTSIPDGAILQFSFVGMISQKIAVNNQTVINVEMKADAIGIDEVVAIGYGRMKKSDLTGSVSSIKSEKLAKSTLSSFDQGISGRAAGVQVVQQTGQPGGATSIRIRGGNSINSSNEPLYVIDGFPYYNDNNGSTAGTVGTAPAINILATLNPGDITNIEILKDASATAIYGSRGANGVILITTKRGKEGQSKVNFESYYGFQEVRKMLPVLNAREFAEFRNMAFVDGRGLNGAGLPTYSAEEVAAMGEGTNWQDEIFRTAPIQNYQLDFLGGSNNVQYAITTNYFDQDGIVINSDLERYSLRANLDAQVNSRLKIGNNFNLSYLTSNLINSGGGRSGTTSIQSPSEGNVIQDALFYNPVIPVYDENGEYTSDNASDTKGSGGGNQANTPNGNPVAYANLATQESKTIRILDNIFAEYAILDDLKFKISFGADIIYNKENRYIPSTLFQGLRSPNGQANVGQAQSMSWLNENTLSYNKTFNENHMFDVLLGATIQKYNSELLGANGRDFPTDVNESFSLQSANITDPSFSNFYQWSLMSYLFRVNYNYKSKLLFTFSSRADGSSKFGENNKYGFFPSAAIGYRISEESFFQNQSTINSLKLRLSAGITGNQEIPAYQSLSTLGITRYPYNNENPVIGYVPSRLGNPDIKWETTKQVNFGFDAELFDGRLGVTADIYYKKTDDLLLQVRLPLSSGFGNTFKNIGSVENKGFEFAVNGTIIDSEFKWTSQLNVSANRNKVKDLGDEYERYIGSDYNLFKGQAVGLLREGEPVGNFIGYINDGIIKNQAELDAAPKSGNDYIGSRRFVDLNGDKIINNEDRAIIGNALPNFVGGFSNTMSYKNFSLDFLFQFSVGNDIYNMTALELEFLNGRQNNSKAVLDRFIPGVNEDTDVARAGNPPYVYFRQSHSRWVEDGSYLRLKNLTLSYNLPVSQMKMNWLQSARVYVTGQNLWLLSNYKGYDPEVNINPQSNTLIGFDYASYPPARVFMLGINVGF